MIKTINRIKNQWVGDNNPSISNLPRSRRKPARAQQHGIVGIVSIRRAVRQAKRPT
jgi:hypothetical protein